MTAKHWVALVIAAFALVCGAIGVWVLRVNTADPVSGDTRAQSELAAAFKQMEKALHEGDGKLYLSLLDRKTLAQMDAQQRAALERSVPARPWAHLEPVAVAARGDRGFVIGSYDDPSSPDSVKSYQVRYVREDGAWKIAALTAADRPPYAPAIHAYFPPEPGPFTQAGSPWQKIPYAELNTKFFPPDQIDWKLQATRDADFLYLRFETRAPLPAPATAIAETDAKAGIRAGFPSSVPVMRIEIAETKGQVAARSRYDLLVGTNIGSRAEFGNDGKATAQHYFLAYSFLVQNAQDQWLFDSAPDADNDLMSVQDRFIDLRIPLAALGLDRGSNAEIRVLEANSFAKIQPVIVRPFG